MVVTGFEPLDILEGIRRTVHQLEDGRAELENAYARVVAPEGNPAARALLADVFEVTDRAWRGIGTIPDSGWRLSAKYRAFDAEYRFGVSDIQTEESADCRSGDVLQGFIKPHECAAFGTLCTPRNPLGRDDGLERGRLRRVLPLPPPGGGLPLAETRRWALDFEGWTCPLPLRDSPTVVMGHGGGGQLSAELVEHLFVPAFGGQPGAGPDRLGRVHPRRRPAGLLHRHLRGAPAVLPRRLDRRPRDQRHGQRPGDERRRARATCRAGSSSRRAPTSRVVGRIAQDMGAAARAAGVAVVTGDTKVVDVGPRRPGLREHRRASG